MLLNILETRKTEIKNNFDNLNQLISNSEYNYTKIENQLNILKINETDFFQVKNILQKNVAEISDTLEDVTSEIFLFEMFLPPGDKYSLVMRFYLENKELGKLIEQLYQPLDNGEFIYLNLGKFKEIMNENWVFESDDFINILNNALIESNKEIKNDLNIKLSEYRDLIEDQLNGTFDDIQNTISDIYKYQIKNITSEQKEYTYNIINELINEFEIKIKAEAERIKQRPGEFDFNINNIRNSFANYTANIITKLNSSIFEQLDNFYDYFYKNIYTDFVSKKTKSFLNDAKKLISEFNLSDYSLLNSSFNIENIIYNIFEDIFDNYNTIISKKIKIKYIKNYEKIKTSINFIQIKSNIQNNLNNIYNNVLLPEIKHTTKCILDNCSIYDFTLETKNYLDNMINVKADKIKNEIKIINELNFISESELQLEISISGMIILKQIHESLKTFLSFENEEQVSKINEFIQDAIKSNLDDFLDNVIPIYGNIFFERIIDYNINFKIVDLYKNLHYGISKTLLYYHTLRIINKNINDLPFDLKIRLYNFNDLDNTVINKAKEIKILSEKKLTELINDLKHEARNIYTQFLKRDEKIKNSFTPMLLEQIDYNLEKIMPEIEKKYQVTLEKYLKEKFMNAFSEIIDEKTDDMIEIYNEEREKLISRLDDLFSSIEDKDLNEVNRNINKTLESIYYYNSYITTFEISEDINYFFINYSQKYLLPLFQKFNSDLHNQYIKAVKREINENSLEFENVSPFDFERRVDTIYQNLFDNYINYFNQEITQYGNTKINYKNNLYNKLGQCDNIIRRRRLVDYDNEKEIEEENKKRIESKYVEESLEQLVNKTRNVKQYIATLNAFTENKKIIKNYKDNLNLDYKEINEIISINKYDWQIESFLKNKLLNITNNLKQYYDSINSSFYQFKNEIINSINNIKISLDNITEITEEVLNNEYQKISDTTNRINITRTNYIEYYEEPIKYIHKSDNMMPNVTGNLYEITEYGQFKLEFTLEGDKFKIPIIKAIISDKTKPKKANIKVLFQYGTCYLNGYVFDINFNDANFTSIIEYDIKTNYINITTYTNIEKYDYNIKQVEKKGEEINETINVNNYARTIKCTSMRDNILNQYKVEVPAKKKNDTQIVFQSNSLCDFFEKCKEGYFLNEENKCLKKCEIGEKEKCKSCDNNYQQYCDSCNENYFLPEKNKTLCTKCAIDNCLECKGNKSYTECIKCEEDFILSNGICLKDCEIGENNKCSKCNEQPGKINQCSLCNEGYYLPQSDSYNKTQCEKCPIEGCNTCYGNLYENNCTKCNNNLTAVYKNNTIISCIKEISNSPERIDIIKNGILVDGIIEIKADHIIKTQLTEGIKYYTYATGCVAKATSWWWKPFEGKPECKLPIYFNISNVLPEGQTKLNEQYRLYLKGTEKFTGVSDSYFNEFMAYPPFYVICNSDFGNKYDGRIYCSDTFGVYKSLEKVNNNGRIMIGGVYNRGSNYYQLEGFNYTTTVANGTQVIGWNFFMNAGDFGKVTGSLSITFIINEL